MRKTLKNRNEFACDVEKNIILCHNTYGYFITSLTLSSISLKIVSHIVSTFIAIVLCSIQGVRVSDGMALISFDKIKKLENSIEYVFKCFKKKYHLVGEVQIISYRKSGCEGSVLNF